MTATNGPRLQLDVGGTTAYATYVSGTTTTDLVFSYTVGAGLTDGPVKVMAIDLPMDTSATLVTTTGGSDLAAFSPITIEELVIDNTAPVVAGIDDDSTALTEKTWVWSCEDDNACTEFRHKVTDSNAYEFTESDLFAEVTTVTESGANGTRYLYVQARDKAGMSRW